MSARPYSPETLAERWGCSAEKIRLMFHAGDLAGFRLGKLIRIPAAEVERYECQSIGLSDTASDSASPLPTPSEVAFASRLARQTGDSQKLALVKSGGRGTNRQANG